MTVGGLEHRNVGMVTVESTAVSVHSPLTVSRPTTVRPRSVKKAIVASRSRTAIPTFSSLMAMRFTLARRTEQHQSAVLDPPSAGAARSNAVGLGLPGPYEA